MKKRSFFSHFTFIFVRLKTYNCTYLVLLCAVRIQKCLQSSLIFSCSFFIMCSIFFLFISFVRCNKFISLVIIRKYYYFLFRLSFFISLSPSYFHFSFAVIQFTDIQDIPLLFVAFHSRKKWSYPSSSLHKKCFCSVFCCCSNSFFFFSAFIQFIILTLSGL